MDCFFRLFCRQIAYGTSSYLVTRSSCRGTYGRIRHSGRNSFKIGNPWDSIPLKKVLQEVEEEMNTYMPKEKVVELSLNRGLATTFGNDEMRQRFERIEKIQGLLTKRIEEKFEEMKIDREIRMTKKIDNLLKTLKIMIDYMKSIPIGASHAVASNLHMEDKEEEPEMVDGSNAHRIIRRKDDDQDEEGQGKQDPQFKIPQSIHKESREGNKTKELVRRETKETKCKVV
ncbi:unnamed protein product [Citrullus colocynthis]|uniref:Uncharacterized protein n=1 Tax=Citrullus colocynthis TaxID=252529 RepID=A0ABP0Z0Z8_9ROSI